MNSNQNKSKQEIKTTEHHLKHSKKKPKTWKQLEANNHTTKKIKTNKNKFKKKKKKQETTKIDNMYRTSTIFYQHKYNATAKSTQVEEANELWKT